MSEARPIAWNPPGKRRGPLGPRRGANEQRAL